MLLKSRLPLMILFFPLLAAATCPFGPGDCVIRDARMSGAELFSRLSDSTRRLLLINVNFTSWPEDAAAHRRAAQLEDLSLNRVFGTVSVSGVMTSLVRLSIVSCCPLKAGGGLHSLDRLAEFDLTGGCKIETLNSTWLGRLPSLRSLAIDSARVDNLHLADLPVETRRALQEIKLSNCNFNKLGDNAFGAMPNLRSLTLDGNIVQYIQPGAFAGLQQLRELSIVLPLPLDGKLVKIWEPLLDGRFDNNTELQTLRLVNARLAEEQIPNALDRLRNLRRLDLSGHRFRNLSNSVLASLTGLHQLDLSNGSLKCLYDRNFGIMKWLERLNLANNEIRVIGQRALLGLTSLTRLDLSGNPIEEIEQGAFCSLPSAVKDSPDLLSFNRSSVRGAANLSEPCPPGFDPNRLVLSSRPQCVLPRPHHGSGDPSGDGRSSSGSQSRHTFLIIIGLCVAFLLITIISMMAYKGWSKRKNAQLAKDEEKELELQAMVAAAEAPPANSDSNGGKKPPHNGRHHQQQHHRHHTAGKSSAAKKSPSTEEAAANDGGEGGGGGEIEVVKAQVESPEKSSTPTESTTTSKGVESPTAQNLLSPSAKEKDAVKTQPQLRPGVTLMTSVPEDSDLEARAITTLVVV